MTKYGDSWRNIPEIEYSRRDQEGERKSSKGDTEIRKLKILLISEVYDDAMMKSMR